jgi:hypothetical protein
MTEHQFSKGDMTDYLICSICDHAAGFPLDQRPLLSVRDLSRMSAHLIQIRDRQIFNVHSPHFAARDAFLVGRPLASNVLKAVSALVSSQYHARGGDISVQGISSQGILQVIDRHLTGMDPVRLVTPELLHAELEILVDDVVYDHLVRQPGSRHRMLAPYFDTGNGDVDFRRQRQVVKTLERMYPDVGGLVGMWDGVVRWVVAVLATHWWDRFSMG